MFKYIFPNHNTLFLQLLLNLKHRDYKSVQDISFIFIFPISD
jgi:hypothetical protein